MDRREAIGLGIAGALFSGAARAESYHPGEYNT